MALEVMEQTESNARTAFAQLKELGIVLTAHALRTNSTWPNVTLPFFDRIAQQAQLNSGMEMVAFAPFVEPEDKERWAHYSSQHQRWIEQDLSLRGITENIQPIQGIHQYSEELDDPDNMNFGGRRVSSKNAALRSRRLDGEDLDHEVFPLWQFSPPPIDSYIVNLDVLSHPALYHIIEDTYEEKIPLISRTVKPHFLLGFAEYEGGSTHEQAHDNHPRNIIAQPIFDSLQEFADRAVGVMFGMISWDIYFSNVLPEGSKPVLVEVGESCTGGFTYRVTGSEFEFVGWGVEKHDTDFDDISFTFEFAKFATYESEDEMEDHCSYIVTVFPTSELRDVYITGEPLLYTFIVVSIFILTAMVFLLYDLMVQRRQTKLLNTAQRTDAIVASLFPRDVQKRIMEEADKKNIIEKDKKSFFAKRAQMKEFIDRDKQQSGTGYKGKPIGTFLNSTTQLANYPQTLISTLLFQLICFRRSLFFLLTSSASQRGRVPVNRTRCLNSLRQYTMLLMRLPVPGAFLKSKQLGIAMVGSMCGACIACEIESKR